MPRKILNIAIYSKKKTIEKAMKRKKENILNVEHKIPTSYIKLFKSFGICCMHVGVLTKQQFIKRFQDYNYCSVTTNLGLHFESINDRFKTILLGFIKAFKVWYGLLLCNYCSLDKNKPN